MPIPGEAQVPDSSLIAMYEIASKLSYGKFRGVSSTSITMAAETAHEVAVMPPGEVLAAAEFADAAATATESAEPSLVDMYRLFRENTIPTIFSGRRIDRETLAIEELMAQLINRSVKKRFNSDYPELILDGNTGEFSDDYIKTPKLAVAAFRRYMAAGTRE